MFGKLLASNNFENYRRVLVVVANQDTILNTSKAPKEIKYKVKVANAEEDYFEITTKNEYEAAKIVSKFVIENDIIDLDFSKEFEVEVEEIDEENEENFDEDEEELDAESFMKMQCENCEYYCPYCGECTFGE